MLGLDFRTFENTFPQTFQFIGNNIYYKNRMINIGGHAVSIRDLYELFFRFKNGLDAFNYYRKFFNYSDTCSLCDIYEIIYFIIQGEFKTTEYKKQVENMKNIEYKKLQSISFNCVMGWKRKVNKELIELEKLREDINKLENKIKIIDKYCYN
jgi:hypothetical protein